MKTRRNPKMSYEPEADVLAYEVGGDTIDHAEEVGSVVVHFTKERKPVLIEILEASKFARSAAGLLSRAGVRLPVPA